MEECGMPSPLPPLYKGTGLRLGRPARPIQTPEARGIRTDPPPNQRRPGFSPPPFATTRTHGRHAILRGVDALKTAPDPA